MNNTGAGLGRDEIHRRQNRLGAETSPYLRQHRFNPVDWWAWGPAAFDEARRRDVPIFLSVGYSTCYWCHVMERESFEDEAIAAQMNADFVCVKVDREERPDVDDIYMAAVQAFTQRGGWPMSVFLEPGTLKPFWAGTYFPAEQKFAGMPTFPEVLSGIARAWKEQRGEVVQQAEKLAEAVKERVAGGGGQAVKIDETQVTLAAAQLLRLHDAIHGGFGGAPKFPQPAFLDLLLEVRRAAGDEETRRAIGAALETTLKRMALGGIFDQVGGGFHRYSVDERWVVPHFEKMLYDNGALMETYARAAAQEGLGWRNLFARTALRVGEYVLREMVSPEGALYSAQDAEVNHREGENYLWTRGEVELALGVMESGGVEEKRGGGEESDASWIARVYGLSAGTNFRDPHHPEDGAKNVLYVVDAGVMDSDFAPGAAFVERVDRINVALYAARLKRDQPGLDDKVLSGWNGLMIAGMAVGGALLKDERFVVAARRAAEFVMLRMRGADGGLMRSYSPAASRASIDGFLEDHAFFVHGLIEVHRAVGTKESVYLDEAKRLVAEAEKRFAAEDGGYYDTLADRSDPPTLFVRARSVHDGAIPSGSSVMLNNLVDLAMITGDQEYARRAGKLLAALSGEIAEHPLGAANATRGLLRMLTLDRGALSRALEEAGASEYGGARVAGGAEEVVEILAAVQEVEIPDAEPAGLVLRVRVREGYHITAADPGEGVVGLTPFRVFIAGGSGVSAYADYPKGEEFGVAGEKVLVCHGEFDVPVVLERSGAWKGRPRVAVQYQACREDACLAARTVEVGVELTPA